MNCTLDAALEREPVIACLPTKESLEEHAVKYFIGAPLQYTQAKINKISLCAIFTYVISHLFLNTAKIQCFFSKLAVSYVYRKQSRCLTARRGLPSVNLASNILFSVCIQ